MNIKSISQVSKLDWDNFCDESTRTWLYHRSGWPSIEECYFAKHNSSFAVVDNNGCVLAICPLYVYEIGYGTWVEKLLATGLAKHASIVIKDDLSSSDLKSVRSKVMQEIFRIAEELDVDRIQLNELTFLPNTSKSHHVPFWVMDYGFHLGLQLAPMGITPAPFMASCAADQLVELLSSEETLFESLKENCRRAIRKAQKMNLYFEVGKEAESSIIEYYELVKKSAVRTGETLLSLEYYKALYNVMGKDKCFFLFVKHDAQIIGGLILGVDKGVAGYMAGVSDSEYLHMRVNDFIHWSTILFAKGQGCSIYRLGPYFPSVPSAWKIAEVSRFKTKFGGYSVAMQQGSYFRYPHKFIPGAIELLKSTYNANN